VAEKKEQEVPEIISEVTKEDVAIEETPKKRISKKKESQTQE
jgi:hypothetical protein